MPLLPTRKTSATIHSREDGTMVVAMCAFDVPQMLPTLGYPTLSIIRIRFVCASASTVSDTRCNICKEVSDTCPTSNSLVKPSKYTIVVGFMYLYMGIIQQ